MKYPWFVLPHWFVHLTSSRYLQNSQSKTQIAISAELRARLSFPEHLKTLCFPGEGEGADHGLLGRSEFSAYLHAIDLSSLSHAWVSRGEVSTSGLCLRVGLAPRCCLNCARAAALSLCYDKESCSHSCLAGPCQVSR